ncbi:hypothetical protein K523DRAFT_324570 [Schizophyllum commune Tattone D]|nr:hypothetical protein K523DRAFT_324570 [Schizophyllum commune Tattone D]
MLCWRGCFECAGACLTVVLFLGCKQRFLGQAGLIQSRGLTCSLPYTISRSVHRRA